MISCVRITTVLIVVIAVLFQVGVPLGMRWMSNPLDPEVGNIVPVSVDKLIETFHGKNALVVGATRGIGRGIAQSLAKFGANVRVVGRSEKGGLEVVENMKNLAPFPNEQHFKSYAYDLSIVKGSVAFAEELIKDDFHMDYLVMTVGVWPDWKNPSTADGLEKVIAVDVLARFIVFTKTAGLLKPGAKVMNVLASTFKQAHPDPETMKKIITYERKDNGFQEILMTASLAGDAFVTEASNRYKNIHFIGTHPGIIDTELSQNTLPDWANSIRSYVNSVAMHVITEEECGDIHSQILASPNAVKKPATFFNHKLEGRHIVEFAKDPDFGTWLWNFCAHFTQRHS